jgi:hypothetical protein
MKVRLRMLFSVRTAKPMTVRRVTSITEYGAADDAQNICEATGSG